LRPVRTIASLPRTALPPWPIISGYGWQRDPMAKKRRTYLPRIVGGKVMMPADLKRLHKYMLEVEHIDHISDEMQSVVEREWPELAIDAAGRTSCRAEPRMRRCCRTTSTVPSFTSWSASKASPNSMPSASRARSKVHASRAACLRKWNASTRRRRCCEPPT